VNLISSIRRSASIVERLLPKGNPGAAEVAALHARLGAARASYPACAIPDVTGARWVSLDRFHRPRGIRTRPGGATKGNWLVLCQGVRPSPALSIAVEWRQRGNIVIMGPNAGFHGELRFQAGDGLIVLGGDINFHCELEVRLSSGFETVLWGRGATSNGLRLIVEGEGKTVAIGDDCMFARDTHLSTSDLHGLSDGSTGEWLNPPADVILGRHVWAGQSSMIAKGVTIGDGAVIGARSLVTRDVAPAALVAGAPARQLRENIVWTRDRLPRRI
jgi:acetyltransferase-like isoleucine patch superfamily enzyme